MSRYSTMLLYYVKDECNTTHCIKTAYGSADKAGSVCDFNVSVLNPIVILR
jgi:hypothetical protein